MKGCPFPYTGEGMVHANEHPYEDIYTQGSGGVSDTLAGIRVSAPLAGMSVSAQFDTPLIPLI